VIAAGSQRIAVSGVEADCDPGPERIVVRTVRREADDARGDIARAQVRAAVVPARTNRVHAAAKGPRRGAADGGPAAMTSARVTPAVPATAPLRGGIRGIDGKRQHDDGQNGK